jgi:hypothetical protein
MKVYILHYQKWEDQYIVGVFTKRESAEKYLTELEKRARKGFNSLNYAILEEDLIIE